MLRYETRHCDKAVKNDDKKVDLLSCEVCEDSICRLQVKSGEGLSATLPYPRENT